MKRIVVVLLVGILVLVGVSCDYDTTAQEGTPVYQWRLSEGEAIALAQQHLQDWYASIPCAAGQRTAQSYLQTSSSKWHAFRPGESVHTDSLTAVTINELLKRRRLDPPLENAWTIEYSRLYWYVYDESGMAQFQGSTYEYMQTVMQHALWRCD